MKRFFALLLCLVTALTLIPAAAAEDVEIIGTDPEEEFEDIGGDGLIAVIDPERPGEEFTAPGDELMASKPTITTQPASVKAYVGTTAKFTVQADGATGYQWYYRTSSSGTWSKSSTTGATTATLSVKAETKRSGYQYRCKLTNSAGYVYTSAATLTVSEKPVITTQPASKTVSAGSTAKFTVKADGAESYQWYYRKTADASWAKTSMTGATTATLSVSATTARNGYQYKCAVKNAKGTTYSSIATMTVTDAKPTITTQPLSYTAGAGATIYFKIKASGAESYQWQYRTSSSDTWKTSSLTGSKSATLTVKATEARRGYQYRCKTSNAAGTTYSKAATLTVRTAQCGEKTTWKLDSAGLLTISGTGAMYDFDIDNSPWEAQRGQIKRVTIGKGVTNIGSNAFCFCDSLTSVTIPESVTRIGYGAFMYCDSLTDLTIPSSAACIDDYAFYRCSSLTDVTIPEGVTSIGEFAFDCCGADKSLTSVTIPESVTSIGYGAFKNCCSLTTIVVSAGNMNYSSQNGVLFNKDRTKLIQYPGGKSGAYTIPEGVTSIYSSAFSDCAKLTSVTIPESLDSIWGFTFENCSSLTSITVSSGNPSFISQGGVLFSKDKTKLILCPAGKSGAYTIPSTVGTICEEAFCSCARLTTVTIPSSVTSIEFGAFEDCSGLTSITLPDSVTEIGSSIFAHCSGLTSFTVPAGITVINDGTFFCCSSLKSVRIHKNITEIGNDAFYGCDSLSDVYYEGTRTQWKKIAIGEDNTPLLNATMHYNA